MTLKEDHIALLEEVAGVLRQAGYTTAPIAGVLTTVNGYGNLHPVSDLVIWRIAYETHPDVDDADDLMEDVERSYHEG